ncbi:MAG: DUF2341 domain-containing protein [Nanoarchaeota archaeon]
MKRLLLLFSFLIIFSFVSAQDLSNYGFDSTDNWIITKDGLLLNGTGKAISYKTYQEYTDYSISFKIRDLPYGLIFFAPFEESLGSTTLDRVNNITGIIYNAQWCEGINGTSALCFNGKNTYVNFGDNNVYRVKSGITLFSWVVDRGNNNGGCYNIIINKEGEYEYSIENNKWYWALPSSDNSWVWHDSGISSTLNSWENLVLTWDNKSKLVRLYKNFTTQNTQTFDTNYLGDVFLYSNKLYIGWRENGCSWGPTNFFNGTIDEVMIFNRSLNSANIERIYKREPYSFSFIFGYLDDNNYYELKFTNPGKIFNEYIASIELIKIENGVKKVLFQKIYTKPIFNILKDWHNVKLESKCEDNCSLSIYLDNNLLTTLNIEVPLRKVGFKGENNFENIQINNLSIKIGNYFNYTYEGEEQADIEDQLSGNLSLTLSVCDLYYCIESNPVNLTVEYPPLIRNLKVLNDNDTLKITFDLLHSNTMKVIKDKPSLLVETTDNQVLTYKFQCEPWNNTVKKSYCYLDLTPDTYSLEGNILGSFDKIKKLSIYVTDKYNNMYISFLDCSKYYNSQYVCKRIDDYNYDLFKNLYFPQNFQDYKIGFFLSPEDYQSLLTNNYYIDIQNPNNQDLTDFQVKVNITDITQSIGYNFIIKDQNGNNVNYCFEQANGECNQTPSNIIWVKVPFIPANSETKLHVYKDDKKNAVNGDLVFDLYDDFNGNSLNMSKWEVYIKGGTGSYTVSNGFLSLKDYNNDGIELISKQYFNLSNRTIEIRVRSSGTGTDLDFHLRFLNLTPNIFTYIGITTNTWESPHTIYYDGKLVKKGNKYMSTYFQILSVYFKDNYYYSNYSNEILSYPYSSNYLVPSKIATDYDGNTPYVIYDWIRIRKYAENPLNLNVVVNKVKVINDPGTYYFCFPTAYTPVVAMNLTELEGCSLLNNLKDLICPSDDCLIYIVQVKDKPDNYIIMIKNSTLSLIPFAIYYTNNQTIQKNINYLNLTTSYFLVDANKDNKYDYLVYFVNEFNKFAISLLETDPTRYITNDLSTLVNINTKKITKTTSYKDLIFAYDNQLYVFNKTTKLQIIPSYVKEININNEKIILAKINSNYYLYYINNELVESVSTIYSFNGNNWIIINNKAINLDTNQIYNVLTNQINYYYFKFIDINNDSKMNVGDLLIKDNQLCEITEINRDEEKLILTIKDSCGDNYQINIVQLLRGIFNYNYIITIPKKPKVIEIYADGKLIKSIPIENID